MGYFDKEPSNQELTYEWVSISNLFSTFESAGLLSFPKKTCR